MADVTYQDVWMCPECGGMMEPTGTDGEDYGERSYRYENVVVCRECGARGRIVSTYVLSDVRFEKEDVSERKAL